MPWIRDARLDNRKKIEDQLKPDSKGVGDVLVCLSTQCYNESSMSKIVREQFGDLDSAEHQCVPVFSMITQPEGFDSLTCKRRDTAMAFREHTIDSPSLPASSRQ
ncbi:hypothetical protein W02_22340 [Nitrospira sp. KM1]|nr:hypothetical protein W02_22340 [Nitrospira sp. KM1]